MAKQQQAAPAAASAPAATAPAAAAAQPQKPARVRKPRKERVPRFSQKAKYATKAGKAKMTVYVRETGDSQFRVFILIDKKGTKSRGNQKDFASKDEAMKFFEETKTQTVKAGWVLQSTVSSDTFDAIPMADDVDAEIGLDDEPAGSVQ